MDKNTFILILVSVLLSSIAQVVLKEGMSSPSIQSAGLHGLDLRLVFSIASNLKVLGGLFIYFASAAVWLLVLARVNVGFAYPFVALGFVFTMLLAWMVRGEIPSMAQLAGTLTICIGVILMARA